jgi:hypothetical protein
MLAMPHDAYIQKVREGRPERIDSRIMAFPVQDAAAQIASGIAVEKRSKIILLVQNAIFIWQVVLLVYFSSVLQNTRPAL